MINRILDFLYPALCELCQTSLSKGRSICSTCLDQLPRVQDPLCQQCGEPFDGNIGQDFTCQNCLGLTHDFLFARASLKGLPTAFHLVHNLKYRRKFFLARDLAQLLHETIEEETRFGNFAKDAFLVPVPLHWRRQQWRQGNQAYELARELSKRCHLPCLDALRRIRPTNTQTKLNRSQRLSNLKGAFEVKKAHLEKIRNSNIILVDDVFTTGATAHQCTRVLRREAHADNVAILTLVRG